MKGHLIQRSVKVIQVRTRPYEAIPGQKMKILLIPVGNHPIVICFNENAQS